MDLADENLQKSDQKKKKINKTPFCFPFFSATLNITNGWHCH